VPGCCQGTARLLSRFSLRVLSGGKHQPKQAVSVSTPASKVNTHRLIEAKEPRLCHKLLDLLASLPI